MKDRGFNIAPQTGADSAARHPYLQKAKAEILKAEN
jgi:hypothetical protein